MKDPQAMQGLQLNDCFESFAQTKEEASDKF